MGKSFTRFGAAAMLAGASLFVIGGQAHASTPATPTCSNHISEAGGSLSGYWFTVNGTKVCSLAGNVDPGDTVRVYIPTQVNPEVQSDHQTQNSERLTLVSYNAPEGSSNLTDQTIFQCASTEIGVGIQVDTADSNCKPGGSKGNSDFGRYLQVDVPDCGFQVDFVFGDVIKTFVANGATYHGGNRFIDGDDQAASDDCGGGSGSPSPTPTDTPTATPTPTDTPTSTPTPSDTPTGGVQGETSTPTPTSDPTGAVQGISTPSTGALEGSASGSQMLAFVLLFAGFVLIGFGRRRAAHLS